MKEMNQKGSPCAPPYWVYMLLAIPVLVVVFILTREDLEIFVNLLFLYLVVLFYLIFRRRRRTPPSTTTPQAKRRVGEKPLRPIPMLSRNNKD
jgi:hypothetical protein